MPILLAGKRSSTGAGTGGARGITLLEMLVVVALIALLAGLTFPSVSAGLDSVRLRSATNSVVAFLNAALSRADRRQEAVQLSVSIDHNALWVDSVEPGFVRRLEMPEGIRIEEVLPKLAMEERGPRRFLLLPGGTPPRIGVQIVNSRGNRRLVRVDPTTGVPNVEDPEQK
ncbi:MAG TPA: prepilin-type N-terminal cleavage/methylation domain-containing protein [Bryobacteraceae bacterium]|jgi:prepilin-type N-terminal cleavage/methylation domain-containing protein|nr:prepilin-type N-terminal cleavage/methylation domain-containing protein [Bryobacteraceae bacterium]